MISQLTVFLENEKGRLAAACRAVSDAGINMHALNLADTSDFGVVRMLTDTPEAAAEALRGQGIGGWLTGLLAADLAARGRRVALSCKKERLNFYHRLGFAAEDTGQRYALDGLPEEK